MRHAVKAIPLLLKLVDRLERYCDPPSWRHFHLHLDKV